MMASLPGHVLLAWIAVALLATAASTAHAQSAQVRFDASSYDVTEADGVAVATLACQGTCTGLRCTIAVSSSSATSGGDYILPSPSEATFIDADSGGTFELQLVDDDVAEMAESISLEIRACFNENGSVAASSTQSRSRFDVLDDDVTPATVSFETSDTTVVSEGGGVTNVTLLLEGAEFFPGITFAVTVNLSGLAASDIVVEPYPTVTFPQGATRAVVSIRALDDATPELAEDARLTLVEATPAQYLEIKPSGPQSAALQVAASDDPYGLFTFAAHSQRVLVDEPTSAANAGAAGTVAVLTVQRSGGRAVASSVTWSFRETDASDDWLATSGELAFAPGVAALNLSVSVRADTAAELSEVFHLQLTSDNGRIVGAAAVLEIRPSDIPAGALQLLSGADGGHMGAEEDEPFGSIVLQVVRLGGSTGNVGGLVTLAAGDGVFAATEQSVVLASGVLSATVEFAILEDEEPEPTRVYLATLSSPTGGAVVDTRYSTLNTTVLASDDAAGVFRFTNTSLSVTAAEGGRVDLVVERLRGHFGAVTVPFAVAGTSASATAGSDVTPAAGELVFASGQTRANITLNVTADDLTEDVESFTVTLGMPTGGARLTESADKVATVVVPANDAALAFVETTPAMRLLREDGASGRTARGAVRVSFDVARSGTVATAVQVSWRFASVAAGQGTPAQLNDDMALTDGSGGSGGTLSFAPGTATATLAFDLLDDSAPEGREALVLQLYNPVGDVVLGARTQLNLTIEASDGAAGTLAFAPASRSTVYIAEPDAADDTTPLAFTVQRLASSDGASLIGTASATYEVRDAISGALATADFASATGVLSFAEGQTNASLALALLGDNVPELAGTYRLILSTVTYPVLLDALHDEVVIAVNASDRPHGVLALQSGSAVVSLAGATGRELRATLVRAFGTFGALNVSLSLWEGAPGAGLLLVEDTAVVAEGLAMTQVALPLPLPGDRVLELGANLTLHLAAARLTGAEARLPSATQQPLKLGSPRSASVLLPAAAAVGTVTFSSSSRTALVAEGDVSKTVTLEVLRVNGLFSRVVLGWAIAYASASSADVGPASGELVLEQGTASAQLQIQVLPDDIPEEQESASVNLTTIVTGHATILNDQRLATVVIARNDNPDGIFAFAPGSRGPFTLYEGAIPLQLEVERTAGALTAVAVDYSTAPAGGLVSGKGRLLFGVGVRSRTIALQATEDSIPEEAATYTVTLRPEAGVVGAAANVSITVPGSDDPNGVLNMTGPALIVAREQVAGPLPVNILVERLAGLFGSVTAPWTVRACSGATIASCDLALGDASTDIQHTTGTVSFAPEDASADISFAVLADEVQEADEYFIVTLGAPSGGARLADPAQRITVRVPANDDLVGFNATRLRVAESDGSAVLFLERQGAALDRIAVVAAIDDVASERTGLPRPWSAPSPQTIVLEAGQFMASFTVPLVVDAEPQPDRVFRVTLSRESGNGNYILDAASSVALVTVAAHGNAAGVFRADFEGVPSTVRARSTSEATPGIALPVVVTRTVAAFGTVVIQILPAADCSGDVSVSPSEMTMAEGTTEGAFNVTAVDDALPELEERCRLTLNVTVLSADVGLAAVVSNHDSLEVVVADSDDPYGVFGFIEATADAQEEDGFVSLAVQRLQGTVGTVRVDYTVTPADGTLFVSTAGSLVFSPGSTQQSLNLLLLDDMTPEFGENYTVALTVNAPGRGDAAALTLQLRVADSDYPYGLLRFDNRSHAADEGADRTRVVLPVTRAFGLSGAINATWRVTACQACPLAVACRPCDGDIREQVAPLAGVLTFADGEDGSSIALYVLPDAIPEVEMRFRVELSDSDPAALAGNNSRTELVVAANDAAYGDFELRVTSEIATDSSHSKGRVLEEANAVASFEVQRTGGALGPVTVAWRVVHVTTSDDQGLVPDVLVTQGALSFATGVEMGALDVPLGDDALPELDESFRVEIVNVTGGATINTARSAAVITIAENDDARGVLSFLSSSVTTSVAESAGMAVLTLERLGGTFGAVSVRWAVTSGDPGRDLLALNGTVLFGESQTDATLEIPLRDDALPETAESFVLQLLDVAGGARLGSRTVALLTLRGSDDPHGVFQFSATEYSVVEPEEAPTMYSVSVERVGGSIGAIDVTVALEPLAGRGIAVLGTDYILAAASVTLTFVHGQTSALFNITLLPDDEPEESERMVFKLASVRLHQDDGPYDAPTPRLGSVNATTVRIAENDDARGVFEVERTAAEVDEGAALPVVVRRRRGLFGRVAVALAVAAPAAPACSNVDHCITSDDVTQSRSVLVFDEGVASLAVNVSVVNDVRPELAELLQVSLLEAPGARLNLNASHTLVSVRPSDDPHGVVLFAPETVIAAAAASPVAEPATGSVALRYAVQRAAGTFGAIAVSWVLEPLDGASPNAQVTPTDDFAAAFGTLLFAEGQRQAVLEVDVVADEAGELEEGFTLRLVRVAAGDARLATHANATLAINGTVAANDDPFGVFSVGRLNAPVTVSEGALLPGEATMLVRRTGGAVGQVDVVYNITSAAPLANLAQRQLRFPLDDPADVIVLQLFDGPRTGALLGAPIEAVADVSDTQTCMAVCLQRGSVTCRSISVQVGVECILHDGVDGENDAALEPLGDYVYYELRENAAALGARRLATAAGDFEAVTAGRVRFNDGEREKNITVTAFADELPELSEYFSVVLTTAVLQDALEAPGVISPRIDTSRALADVVIPQNDDPYGLLAWDASASSRVALEQDGATLRLVVQRTAGAVGRQKIQWRAVVSAATAGDISPLLGELILEDGQRSVVQTINVINDDTPELDETIDFVLSGVDGGARVNPAGSSARTVIRGNDLAAGTFAWSTASRNVTVAEQDEAGAATTLRLNVTRQGLTRGPVALPWRVSNALLPAADAGLDFESPNGTLHFADGQTAVTLTLVLRQDAPELAETFTVTLGTPSTPAAVVDADGATARVHVQADPEAYGTVEIAADWRAPLLAEGDVANVVVQRSGGALAAIRVAYRTEARATVGDTAAATANSDFLALDGTLDLAIGVYNATIAVTILDDTRPELAESFALVLFSVELLPDQPDVPVLSGTPTLSPSLAEAAITINANDDAAGVFSFAEASVVTAEAIPGQRMAVQVLRGGGTLGRVVLPLTVLEGPGPGVAQRGRDFDLAGASGLVFEEGQAEATVFVTLYNDAIPELAERFRLVLGAPSAGRLALPSAVAVTISESDTPRGLLRFDEVVPLNTTLPEPVRGAANFSLEINRGPGAFEDIAASLTLLERTADGTLLAVSPADVTVQPTVVSFLQGQAKAVATVRVHADGIPELARSYVIRLTSSDTDVDTTRAEFVVLVPDNEDPLGVVGFAPAVLNGTYQTTEAVAPIRLPLTRTAGALGFVRVQWTLQNATGDLALPRPISALGDALAVYVAEVQPNLSFAPSTPAAPLNGADAPVFEQASESNAGESEAAVLALSVRGRDSVPLLLWDGAGRAHPLDTLETPDVRGVRLLRVSDHTWIVAALRTRAALAWRYNHRSGTLTALPPLPLVGATAAALVGSVAGLSAAADGVVVVLGQPDEGLSSPVVALSADGTTWATLTTLALPGVSDLRGLRPETRLFAATTRSSAGGAPTLHVLQLAADGSGVTAAVPATTAPAQALRWSYLPPVDNNASSPAYAVAQLSDAIRLWPLSADGNVTAPTDVAMASGATPRAAQWLVLGHGRNSNPNRNLNATLPRLAVFTTAARVELRAAAAPFEPAVDALSRRLTAAMESESATLGGGNALALFAGGNSTDVATAPACYAVVANASASAGRVVRILAADTQADVVPMSGELALPAGVATTDVLLHIIDDTRPELSQSVQAIIKAVVGGGRVDTTRAALAIHVSPSDAPNGRFAFAAASRSVTVFEGAIDRARTLTVVRAQGDAGAVTVAWTLTPAGIAGGVTPAGGTLLFAPGMTSQDFVVVVAADSMPEPAQVYTVSLSIITGGGELDSEAGAVRALVTVPANDDAHGVLQLSALASSQNLLEGDTVQLTVTRSAGAIGAVVARLAIDGAASASGVGAAADPAADLNVTTDVMYSANGTALLDVLLADGEEEAHIVLTVRRDGLPEPAEGLHVRLVAAELANRTVVDEVGSPRVATVNGTALPALEMVIAASDDASGVFSFAAQSTAPTVNESAGVVSLTVVRSGGAFGGVSVEWRTGIVLPNNPPNAEGGPATLGEDFGTPSGGTSLNGTLTFADGQQSASLHFTVTDDSVPELTEYVAVELLSVSGGVAGSVPRLASPPPPNSNASDPLLAVIAIAENDDIRGRFAFAVESRNVSVRGEGVFVTLTVERTRGLVGDVRVAWQATQVDSAGLTEPNGPAATTDLTPAAGELLFLDGDAAAARQNITLLVVDDQLPEVGETFIVSLWFAADVGDGASLAPTESGGTALLAVPATNDANGVFGFATAQVAAVEPDAGTAPLSLAVERAGGAAGAVTLLWQLLDVQTCDADSASECGRTHPTLADFAAGQATNGSVLFDDGQRSASVVLTLRSDSMPEGEETFRVRLALQSPTGVDGGVDVARSEVTVQLSANDDGPGVLAFAAGDASGVILTEGDARGYNLTVLRSVGDFGRVSVSYIVAGAGKTQLATPFVGELVWLDGEEAATVALAVKEDAVPELPQELTVTLGPGNAVKGGAAVGSPHVAVVVIAASDAPHGLFTVATAAISPVGEDALLRELSIVVARESGGRFGAVTATVAVTFASSTAAAADRDLLAALCPEAGCTVIIPDGAGSGTLTVALPAAARVEYGDTFIATLTQVMLVDADAAGARGAQLPALAPQGPHSKEVTVGVDVANNAVTVTAEPSVVFEGSVASVRISRNSKVGSVSGAWVLSRAEGDSAGGNDTDSVVTDLLPVSGSFTLAPGVVDTIVMLTVRADGLPEPAELFLFTVTAVAAEGDVARVRTPSASLRVAESDAARGTVYFDPSAEDAASNVSENIGRLELLLRRDGGTVGAVLVTVEVAAALLTQVDVRHPLLRAAEGDTPALYAVTFADGAATTALVLDVINDNTPEPPATFSVTLVNVSVPTSGAIVLEPPTLATTGTTLAVQLAASDDAFGRLSFATPHTTTVAESSGVVILRVQRQGGLFGAVSVAWALQPGNGIITSPPGTRDVLAEGVDYVTPDGTYAGVLHLAEGQEQADIEVELLDDTRPEGDERITAVLSAPVGGAVLDAAGAVATVVIAANDVPRGHIAMQASTLLATEGTTLSIPVQRTGGRFGSVSIAWRVVPQQGLTLGDLEASEGTVTFEGNAAAAAIVLHHVKDDEPELAETYDVVLSSPGPGAVLGALTSTRVTVAANDDPHGVLGFDCASQFGGGNADGRGADAVTLRVERLGGAVGAVTVRVMTTTTGTAPATAYIPVGETLVFADGQRSATVRLQTRAVGDTAGGATVRVVLTAATGGARLATAADTATVTFFRTEVVANVLAAAATAACDPTAGFDPPALASGSGLTQGTLSAMIQAVQTLLPLVRNGVAGADTTLDDIFRAALIAGDGGQTLRYEPLPALFREYADTLLSLRGAAFCPGAASRVLGGAATLMLQRETQAAWNGAAATTPDSAVAMVLPQNLFVGNNASTACTGFTVADYSVATWFPTRGHFYAVAPSDPRERQHRRDRITTVAGSRVADVALPAGADAAALSYSNPLVLLFEIPSAGSDADVTEHTCAWWDGTLDSGAGAWTTQGCVTAAVSPSSSSSGGLSVRCECVHATPFAVLASRPETESLPALFIAAMAVLLVGLVLVAVASSCVARWERGAAVTRTRNKTASSSLAHGNGRDGITSVSSARSVFSSTSTTGVVGSTDDALGTRMYLRLVYHQWGTAALAALLLLVSALVANSVSKAGCAALGLVTHLAVVSALLLPIQLALHVRAVVLRGQDWPSAAAERASVRQRVVVNWVVAVLVVALYAAVHASIYDSFVDSTYGALTVERELCLIPRHSWGSWLAVLLAPVLLGAGFLLAVWISVHSSLAEWRRHDDLVSGRPNARELKVTALWQGLLLLVWALAAIAVLVNSIATSAVLFAAAVILVLVVLLAYVVRVGPRGGRSLVEAHHLTELRRVDGGDGDHTTAAGGARSTSTAWGPGVRGGRYLSPYLAGVSESESDVDSGRARGGQMQHVETVPNGHAGSLPAPAWGDGMDMGTAPSFDQSYLRAPVFSEPASPVAAAMPHRAAALEHPSERKLPLPQRASSTVEPPDEEFDDLIYALQTGELAHVNPEAFMAPSDRGSRFDSISGYSRGDAGFDSDSNDGSNFALRRYSIADTHL